MSISLAPNHDLVSRLRGVTREEPEEELSCLIFLTGDGEETRVTLADIPRNVGKSASVDRKCWDDVSQELTIPVCKTYVRWLG
jgi:hypothetical protein